MVPGLLDSGTTFRLGMRNLFRNRRRTLITASTVAIAVMLMQFSFALMMGLEQQSFDNLINYQTGHAKVYAAGYFEERNELPLEPVLNNVGALRSEIESIQGVAATTPRLTFFAQISNGVDQIPCQGIGIDLAGSDDDVFRLPDAIVDGDYLNPDEEGMLLGSGLADLFEVGPGDWLTVLTRTVAGAYEALDLPISGVVGTGNPLIDQNSFLISLSAAQQTLEMPGTATELAVRFRLGAREGATLKRVSDMLAGESDVEVKGWRTIEDNFLALTKMKRSGQGVLLGIMLIMAVVGITNTILMATYERTREIGMLMALGMRRQGIRRLFMAEGAVNGLLGGLIGTLLGLIPIIWLASTGWDLTATYGDMDIGYPVRGVIYPAVNFLMIFLIWIFTGLMAIAAAWYPAARASRLNAVEALRHV
jgi:putative ABC transport system permease protein